MHFAIFQTWGLGDLVMTTPVISEFRRLYPEGQLTLIVGGRQQAELMKDSPFVDQVLQLPQTSTRISNFRFFFGLRRRGIDAAFMGTRIEPRFAWLLRGVGSIPVIIGDAVEVTHRYPYTLCNSIDPVEHRVDRMLKTFALWSQHPPSPPKFSIATKYDEVREAISFLVTKGLTPRRFVVFHPGSSGGPKQRDKRIPAEVARRVADNLVRSRDDVSIAFIFGPDDIDLIPHFKELGPRQVVLTDCPLSTTVAILSLATGFIGSDSGLGHIAAALDVPTITLIGPTNPSETATYGSRATTIKRLEKLECQPCWFGPLQGRCPHGIRCMHELPEYDIVATVMTWKVPLRDEHVS